MFENPYDIIMLLVNNSFSKILLNKYRCKEESMSSDSLMKNIIDNLQNKAVRLDFSGWNTLDSKPAEEIAQIIYETVNETCSYRKFKSAPIIRERYNFSLVKINDQTTPWRKEEALERLLISKHANLRNQYSVGDGKESIDLIKIGPKESIVEIIELKTDSISGKSKNKPKYTPLYAAVELLKNYFLMKNRELDTDLKFLVLLAPQKYFDAFSKQDKIFNHFKNILINLNAKISNGIIISLQSVEAGSDDINDALESLLEIEFKNLDWKESTKEKYEKITSLEKQNVTILANKLGDKLEINAFFQAL